MNLISFKNLNIRNKLRIINRISEYYPYENINHIYQYFLEDMNLDNVNYYLINRNNMIHGVGIYTEGYQNYLCWPLIFLDHKYFGNHKKCSYILNKKSEDDFTVLLSVILQKQDTYSIFLSNYGIEEIIGNILEKVFNFKKYETSKESYFGHSVELLENIKHDQLNYRDANKDLQIIRNNPEEKIYVYTNRIL